MRPLYLAMSGSSDASSIVRAKDLTDFNDMVRITCFIFMFFCSLNSPVTFVFRS